MGKKKRQFIDKKTAQKFTLVHRSQRDPLQADEDSAQHVLVPISDESVAGTASVSQVNSEERFTYGIYFDDEYDYMQHLRPRGEGIFIQAGDIHAEHNQEPDFEQKTSDKIPFGKILLPSEALPSKTEEKIGMLNKGVLPRGPQPDWDPDITAALDDAVDFNDPDNILEDDFMHLANPNSDMKSEENNEERGYDEEQEWETTSEGSDGSIGSDNLLSDDELCDYDEEETKSRFTSYSMTSSIIRRTEGLKLLDDKFERIMEEYDEDEIGCMDHEDVTGNFDVNNELVKQVVDEFIDDQRLHELSETKDSEDEDRIPQNEFDSEEDESDEKLFAQFKKEPKESWDCESIISTYSNIYNHPKLIIEKNRHQKIELNKHTGIPVGVFSEKKKDIITESDDEKEIVILNNVRNKNETPEEKKKRKQDVKEQRKNRRVEKKSNKIAFQSEYINQEKVMLNKISQQGIKM